MAERVRQVKEEPEDIFEELEEEEMSSAGRENLEEPEEETPKPMQGGAEEELVPVKREKKKKGKKHGQVESDEDTEITRPKAKPEEPAELTVSESQKKTHSDEETDIVKPKKQKWKEPKVSGIKEEKEETDIYRPKNKQEGKWAKEKEVSAEEELEKEEGIKEEDAVEEFDFEDENLDIELEDEGASTEGIRKRILEKARNESIRTSETSIPLKFLEDAGNVFIGRKKSVHSKYGMEGALFVGKVGEQEQQDKNVYLDSLNPHVVFVCGARGSGKCLDGNTLITLADGSEKPIKELEADFEVLSLDDSLKVKPVGKKGFFKRPVERMLELTLSTGKRIKLTPEHPLLTINGWIEAEKISTGGRIATPRSIGFFGNAKARECDVKLLAYLLAEGHLSNQFVLFSNTDEKIISEFRQAIAEFDENLRIETHSKEGCFRIAQKKKQVDISSIKRDNKGMFTNESKIKCSKSSLMQWLESIGVYGKLSAEKFIPQEIFRLEKEQLSVFLNRLFSCDGSIYRINNRKNNWGICYASSSEKMIFQVQSLLLKFGIASNIREKKVKCNGKEFKAFELVVYGENVLKFIAEIGFFGKKGVKEEIALQEMACLSRNPNKDTVPAGVWKQMQGINWMKTGREFGYKNCKSFRNVKNYSPSREKLLKIAQINNLKGIEMLAQSDIYWDEIKQVKELNGDFEVFDIEVPEMHNFIANNIIVHNSYVLGVIAEELALKNNNVGVVVIDPIGVFWSMRFPNREKKEIEAMAEWNLLPEGLKNLKVFIPEGIAKDTPKNTYDATFSIQPSLLTGEDWCLTFGIERFSPTGLLLEKAIKRVESGYKTLQTSEEKAFAIKGKGKKYGIDDIVHCLEKDAEINSREKGFKQDSVRALISRFEAAKNWGVFSEDGTPLAELSREGQLTVMDTSFLEDNVTALVIGILARRLLAARKITTRKEASVKFKEKDMDQVLELEIPPTWLFIDEAHTLIPSGNLRTPASAGLIEYVKQGRRPGLSLVFATQQPSAIDTKVLSQLDVIMSHKLVFDDDIKAIYKRTPTIIPSKYRKATFVKTLPVGVALTGDRAEETSRAFIMRIRPRMSQHEGRDAVTMESTQELSASEVQELAFSMAKAKLEREGIAALEKIRALAETLGTKYKAKTDLESLLKALEKAGFVIDKTAGTIAKKGFKPLEIEKPAVREQSIAETIEETAEQIEEDRRMPSGELTELIAIPAALDEGKARKVFDSLRQKKVLGLFGSEERITSMQLKYRTVWKVLFNEYNLRKEFSRHECYIDSASGEFLHFNGKEFIESKGAKLLYGLNDEETAVVLDIAFKKKVSENSEQKFRKIAESLVEKGIIGKKTDKGIVKYTIDENRFDLPPSPMHDLLSSIGKMRFVTVEALGKEKEKYSREDAIKLVQGLWPTIIVKKIEDLNRPFFEAVLQKPNGEEKTKRIDALSGKAM